MAVIPAWAQTDWQEARIEISFFGGWQYGGTIKVENGKYDIRNSYNYGCSLGFPVYSRPGLMGEILYSRQETYLDYTIRTIGNSGKIFDMSVEYFQVGGNYGEKYGRFFPYGAMLIGVTRFHPKGVNFNDAWLPFLSIKFGTKIYLTKRFGLRLQTGLLMPMKVSSGSMFCSNGSCVINLKVGTVIYQGNITVGIMIQL